MAAGDKYITSQNNFLGAGQLLRSMILEDADGKPYLNINASTTPPFVPPLKLYFGVNTGGANNNGTFLEYNLSTETVTKKVDFLSASTGAQPLAGIKKYSNGKYYGWTISGGSANQGTMFEYNILTGSVTKIIDFVSATNGQAPYHPMTETSDGRFFGTTDRGGISNRGTIYEFFPLTNTLVTKKNFDSNLYGVLNKASLVEFNGKLYGVTNTGLSGKFGSIYEYDWINDVLTNKYDFTGSGFAGATGTACNRPMLLISGEFYGISSSGGLNASGTFWKFNPTTNIFTLLHDFINTPGLTRIPYGIIFGLNNIFYIVLAGGGTNNVGGINKYDPSLSLMTNIYNFPASGVGTVGALPSNQMYQTDIDKFYGCTISGGASNQGTIYEFNILTNTLTRKYSFSTANGTGISPNQNNFYLE